MCWSFENACCRRRSASIRPRRLTKRHHEAPNAQQPLANKNRPNCIYVQTLQPPAPQFSPPLVQEINSPPRLALFPSPDLKLCHSTGAMTRLKHRVFAIKFASLYTLYVKKAESKKRTKKEVDQII